MITCANSEGRNTSTSVQRAFSRSLASFGYAPAPRPRMKPMFPRRSTQVRYAYAITAAMLLGGAAATVTLQQPLGAQVAQNAPSQIAAVGMRGAPTSFADLVAKLQPAVVNISTTQKVQVRQQQNPFAGTPFGDLFRRFGAPGGVDANGQPVTRA